MQSAWTVAPLLIETRGVSAAGADRGFPSAVPAVWQAVWAEHARVFQEPRQAAGCEQTKLPLQFSGAPQYPVKVGLGPECGSFSGPAGTSHLLLHVQEKQPLFHPEHPFTRAGN